jgi:hypothetical protein
MHQLEAQSVDDRGELSPVSSMVSSSFNPMTPIDLSQTPTFAHLTTQESLTELVPGTEQLFAEQLRDRRPRSFAAPSWPETP